MFAQVNPDNFAPLLGNGNAVTLAAGGVTQALATLLTGAVNRITGANATAAVVLPLVDTTKQGSLIVIDNPVAAVLPVFPPASGTINGAGANAAKNIPASSVAFLISFNGVDWIMFTVTRT